MTVALALIRHHINSIAKILQHLTPQHLDITLSYQFTAWDGQQGHIAVHGSQLIIIVSAQEERLTEELTLEIVRHGRTRQGLNQRVGTVDTLVALSPEHVGHIVTIVTHQVKGLHQFIVGTTTAKLVVTGQTGHVEIGALWIGVRGIQILINTGEHGDTIFFHHGEVLSRKAADVLYIVNVTRSEAECGNGCSK